MKLSNSGINRYLECGRSYKLHYRDRIMSKYKSSALYFGSAFDLGVNELLKGESIDKAIAVFKDAWEHSVDLNGVITELKEHQYVNYYDSDFDNDLLDEAAKAELKQYAIDTGNSFNIYEVIGDQKIKRKDGTFKSQSLSKIKYFNLINWHCLNNKGEYMLRAYEAQLLPKFKKILSLQTPVKLESSCGDTVEGVIDFVARLEDGSIAVMDNKTSSMDYSMDSVKLS